MVGCCLHSRRAPRLFSFTGSALESQSTIMATNMLETESGIKTRFLIISDTHSADPSQNLKHDDISFRPPLPAADVLLHCGDLTMVGLLEEYERTFKMLESVSAPLKLVIAGNHDISLDEAYFERKGEYMQRRNGYDKDLPKKARELWTGDRARMAGIMYLDEGTHNFTLSNGALLRVKKKCIRTKTLLTIADLRFSIPARVL